MSKKNKDIDSSQDEIQALKAELEELKANKEINNLKSEIESLKKNKNAIDMNQVNTIQGISMSTPILKDEKIIKQSLANHWRGIESVGGRLFLTSERLIFESHAFNIQTGNTVIPLLEINLLEKDWSKLLFIPIFPNIINVYSRNNIKNAFVVWGRTKWLYAIDKVKKKI